MAYFCPDCKIIFEKRAINCPRCGYGVATDSQADSFYLNQGFSVFKFPQSRKEGDSVKINDEDILQKIRGRYSDFIKEEPKQPASPVPPSSQEQPQQQPASGYDFFAAFNNNDVQTPETIIEEEHDSEPEAAPVSIPVPQFEEIPRTNNYYTPRRQRIRTSARRPVRIPWRMIGILAIFAIVIAIIAIIWSMRFVILESIISILTPLIPAAVVIGIIIYCISNRFRR